MLKESFFTRLYKKASIWEDFVTEGLSAVLASLPAQSLVDFFVHLRFPELPIFNPSFETQQTTLSGRNDLIVKDKDILIIFEIKWDSPLNRPQLHRYDEFLHNQNKSHKYLIHLAKDYEEIRDEFKTEFKKISWGNLYAALLNLKLQENHLVNNYLLFLKEGGIAMEKVSWEIISGAKSIYSLTRIIQRACEEMGVKCAWSNTSSDYTAQVIAEKLGAYFLFEKGSLLFTSPKNHPDMKEMTYPWKNIYGIYFDFDKNYYFHKNLEEQVDTLKIFIGGLLSKFDMAESP